MRLATEADLLRRWQLEGPRPRVLQAVLEWVAKRLRDRNPAAAVELLESLLSLKEDPALWGYLAQAHTASGKPAKAAEALVRHLATEANPQPAVYVAAVDAFAEAGKADRARALANRAPTPELRAFLLSRLRQDTGRAPRPKAPKAVKDLAKLEREALMRILKDLPFETVAAALSGEKPPVRDAVLDCFSGPPRHRLASLMGRETGAQERKAAQKALLLAAKRA